MKREAPGNPGKLGAKRFEPAARAASERAIALLPVDEVRITIVLDNVVDLVLPASDVAHRLTLGPAPYLRAQPVGEQSFSARVQATRNGRTSDVLFDAGFNPSTLLWNLDALDVDIGAIQAIVLSHGHQDHVMGLRGLVQRLSARGLPVVLHPDAYLERKLVLPDGGEVSIGAPHRSDLLAENLELLETRDPSILLDGAILVTGEVARTTTFERGFPTHHALREQGWEPDPLILDDQALVVHVRDKGLVVLTGCGHAGVVNIARHAQQITGVQQIHAILGGFHLYGSLFLPQVPATIQALKAMNPRYLVPGHCTTLSAQMQLAGAMPDAFIPNSVGSTYVF